MEVRFCENNFTHGTDELVERLKDSGEDIRVEVESCLGECGDCAEGPFAMVEDEMLQADSADELYDLIMEKL